MNLQTSFLTPPFGFALFYLRSVAPKSDYQDRVTGQNISAISTSQIYKGSIAFIILQIAMVAAIISYPQLVTGGLQQKTLIDADAALEQMLQDEAQPDGTDPEEDDPAEDPARALERELKEKK